MLWASISYFHREIKLCFDQVGLTITKEYHEILEKESLAFTGEHFADNKQVLSIQMNTISEYPSRDFCGYSGIVRRDDLMVNFTELFIL